MSQQATPATAQRADQAFSPAIETGQFVVNMADYNQDLHFNKAQTTVGKDSYFRTAEMITPQKRPTREKSLRRQESTSPGKRSIADSPQSRKISASKVNRGYKSQGTFVLSPVKEKPDSGFENKVKLKQNPKMAKKEIAFQENMKKMEVAFGGKSGRPNIDYNESILDSKKIRDNLVLTALDHMITQLDNRVSVPKALEQNKFIWAKAMFKSKSLQDLIANFSNQITKMLQKELNRNQDRIEKFMKVTRAPEKTLNSAKAYIESALESIPESPAKGFRGQRSSKNLQDSKVSQTNLTNDPNNIKSSNSLTQTENMPLVEEDDSTLNFHDLARKIKNNQSLYNIVLEYMIPNNIESNLQPTDAWLKDICFTRELITFTHKKQALEEIKEQIEQEIERKRVMAKLATSLTTINQHMTALEDKATFFIDRNENLERLKQDQVITQYKLLMHVDPVRANQLIYPKANEYMYEIYDDKQPEHTNTIEQWHNTWGVNENFESDIMEEMRWYKLDMIQLRRRFNLALQNLKSKSFFYIMAQEKALNELKLQYTLEIERLSMRVEDMESDIFRQNVEKEADEGFIESFLSTRPDFKSLKDAVKYLETLKLNVKTQHMQYKKIKKEHEHVKVQYELSELRRAKLEEENKAKTAYFDWMTKVACQGANPSFPKMYFNQEEKKKLEIFHQEEVFAKHQEIMQRNKVLTKFMDDITLSKVLSILAYNLYEIIQSTGLLRGKPEIIKNLGFKKYKFTNEQLLEIFYLFKTPTVELQVQKLTKYRDELRKYKQQYAKEGSDKLDAERAAGSMHPGGIMAGIDERFRKLSKNDKLIPKWHVEEIVKWMMLPPDKTVELSQVDNSNSLIYLFNDYNYKSTTSENEDKDRQMALLDHNQRIQDTLIIENDRLMVDTKRFVLFVYDSQNKLFGQGAEEEVKFYQRIGQFMQQILTANRVLGGVYNENGHFVKEVDPEQVASKHTQIGRDLKRQTMQMRFSNMPMETSLSSPDSDAQLRTQSQITMDEPQETEMNDRDTQDKVRDLEKKLADSLRVIGEMQEELDKAGIKFKSNSVMANLRKSLQNKILTKLQMVLLQKGDGQDASIVKKFNHTLLQDIINISQTILKSIELDQDGFFISASAKEKLAEACSKQLTNTDIFCIQIEKLHLDVLFEINEGTFKNWRIPKDTGRRIKIFNENTIGDLFQNLLFFHIEEILHKFEHRTREVTSGEGSPGSATSKKKKNLAHNMFTALKMKGTRGASVPMANAKVQTDLEMENLTEYFETKLMTLDSPGDSKSSTLRKFSKGGQIKKAKRSRFQGEIQGEKGGRATSQTNSTLNLAIGGKKTKAKSAKRRPSGLDDREDDEEEDEDEEEVTSSDDDDESGSINEILKRRARRQKHRSRGGKSATTLSEEKQSLMDKSEFYRDLYFHDIYSKMNFDQIMDHQASEMFPPQQHLSSELYKEMSKKLDFIGKNFNQKLQRKAAAVVNVTTAPTAGAASKTSRRDQENRISQDAEEKCGTQRVYKTGFTGKSIAKASTMKSKRKPMVKTSNASPSVSYKQFVPQPLTVQRANSNASRYRQNRLQQLVNNRNGQRTVLATQPSKLSKRVVENMILNMGTMPSSIWKQQGFKHKSSMKSSKSRVRAGSQMQEVRDRRKSMLPQHQQLNQESMTVDQEKLSISPKMDGQPPLTSTYGAQNNVIDGTMCILDAITAEAMTSSFRKNLNLTQEELPKERLEDVAVSGEQMTPEVPQNNPNVKLLFKKVGSGGDQTQNLSMDMPDLKNQKGEPAIEPVKEEGTAKESTRRRVPRKSGTMQDISEFQANLNMASNNSCRSRHSSNVKVVIYKNASGKNQGGTNSAKDDEQQFIEMENTDSIHEMLPQNRNQTVLLNPGEDFEDEDILENKQKKLRSQHRNPAGSQGDDTSHIPNSNLTISDTKKAVNSSIEQQQLKLGHQASIPMTIDTQQVMSKRSLETDLIGPEALVHDPKRIVSSYGSEAIEGIVKNQQEIEEEKLIEEFKNRAEELMPDESKMNEPMIVKSDQSISIQMKGGPSSVFGNQQASLVNLNKVVGTAGVRNVRQMIQSAHHANKQQHTVSKFLVSTKDQNTLDSGLITNSPILGEAVIGSETQATKGNDKQSQFSHVIKQKYYLIDVNNHLNTVSMGSLKKQALNRKSSIAVQEANTSRNTHSSKASASAERLQQKAALLNKSELLQMNNMTTLSAKIIDSINQQVQYQTSSRKSGLGGPRSTNKSMKVEMSCQTIEHQERSFQDKGVFNTIQQPEFSAADQGLIASISNTDEGTNYGGKAFYQRKVSEDPNPRNRQGTQQRKINTASNPFHQKSHSIKIGQGGRNSHQTSTAAGQSGLGSLSLRQRRATHHNIPTANPHEQTFFTRGPRGGDFFTSHVQEPSHLHPGSNTNTSNRLAPAGNLQDLSMISGTRSGMSGGNFFTSYNKTSQPTTVGKINEQTQYQQKNFKPFFDMVNVVEGKNFQKMHVLQSHLQSGYQPKYATSRLNKKA